MALESLSGSRRAMLVAAVSGIAAVMAQAVGRSPVVTANDPNDVRKGTGNITTSPTGIVNNDPGETAFYGQATADGIGVYGQSTSGMGVAGRSESGPAVRGESTNSSGVVGVSNTADGVVGLSQGTASGVLGRGGKAAVFGQSSDRHTGVHGYSGHQHPGPSGRPVGVLAEAGSLSETGLLVLGRANFSRSGTAPIPVGAAVRVIPLEGVHADSLVFAVLSVNAPDTWVRSAEPGVDKVTIRLNRKAEKPTRVTWIVFDLPPGRQF